MTNIDRVAQALRTSRDYIASELARQRDAFKGYEHCSEIAECERDLAEADAALASLAPAAVEGEPVAWRCYVTARGSMPARIDGWIDGVPTKGQIAVAAREDWRIEYAYSAAQVAALTAQCEGLRKDAERYRWLRSEYVYDDGHWHLSFSSPHNLLDTAIDSAIAAGNGEGGA